MATRALVHLPPAIRRGEAFEVRTTLAHPMETGYRRDSDGQMLPRDIVRRLEVRLGSELVFAADLHQAIAANPMHRLQLRWLHRQAGTLADHAGPATTALRTPSTVTITVT